MRERTRRPKNRTTTRRGEETYRRPRQTWKQRLGVSRLGSSHGSPHVLRLTVRLTSRDGGLRAEWSEMGTVSIRGFYRPGMIRLATDPRHSAPCPHPTPILGSLCSLRSHRSPRMIETFMNDPFRSVSFGSRLVTLAVHLTFLSLIPFVRRNAVTDEGRGGNEVPPGGSSETRKEPIRVPSHATHVLPLRAP